MKIYKVFMSISNKPEFEHIVIVVSDNLEWAYNKAKNYFERKYQTKMHYVGDFNKSSCVYIVDDKKYRIRLEETK